MTEFEMKEFRKHYQHTFVGLQISGSEKPVAAYINDVLFNNKEIAFIIASVQSADGSTTVTTEIKFTDFTLLPHPDKQLIDVGGLTYLFARVPNRQWQRGISNSNSSLFLCTSSFLNPQDKKLGVESSQFSSRTGRDFNLRIIQSLYDNIKTDFKKAVQLIEQSDTALSMRISPTYFVALTPKSKDKYILFRNTIPLAMYNQDRDEFTLIKEIYNQELADFCNRAQLKSSIRR